jgi:hypothetical protein
MAAARPLFVTRLDEASLASDPGLPGLDAELVERRAAAPLRPVSTAP